MKACIHRPDENNMRRLLAAHEADTVGLALRLAYFEGLSRAELCALRFADVDFDKKCLRVRGREIPLSEETEACLLARRGEDASSPVLLSRRSRKPLSPESLSRLVREALDSVGETETRLADLRHDYVLRSFAALPIEKALAVTGLKLASYESCYLPYTGLPSADDAETEDKLFRLWRLLQEGKSSPAGIALWLTWQMGLTQKEIAALTWAQVDFGGNRLLLAARTLPLTSAVRRVLAEEQRRRKPGDDPHVILSPRARKSVDGVRLSKMMRETLLSAGLADLPARSLRRQEDKEEALKSIEALARESAGIARADVMKLLVCGASAATARLRLLTEQGKLLRVGGKYYPRDGVVPPEEQYETLRAFLAENEGAYLEDIARLLGIRKRQCSTLLHGYVLAGRLKLKEKRYYLP